ncbi:hypothetical protein B2I21_34960 [Chryseobacterium mucoviscidosis]|nr:hypothetical protein B2I21_34960 [Chryseobacterium mucoviscidosis]
MKQQTFKSVDDILRHYGWEAPIKLVEVRRDAEGKTEDQTEVESNRAHDVPASSEDCEGEGNAEQQFVESVPEKLCKGS